MCDEVSRLYFTWSQEKKISLPRDSGEQSDRADTPIAQSGRIDGSALC